MTGYFLFSLLIVVAATLSYINSKFLKLPKALGLTILSISLSLVCIITLKDNNFLVIALGSFDFRAAVLDGMISFLLFANALHFNIIDFKKEARAIFALASIGVVFSTIITATLIYWITHLIGFKTYFSYCLVFGALISPTDPIAVISTLASNKCVPKHIKTRVVGESLFNDATGIVLFVVLANIVFFDPSHSAKITAQDVSYLWPMTQQVITEAGGGILLGYVFAKIANFFIKTSQDTETSIFITLAIASMGYLAAYKLHVSGPIAMVVSGLFIGKSLAILKKTSPKQVQHLDSFWLIIDNMLNSFLFILIGLELTSISFSSETIITGFIAIFVINISRFISISIPITVIDKNLSRTSVRENLLIGWAGIRGGVSLALALSLPDEGHVIVSVTYIVVVLSIIVQGSTLKTFLNKIYPSHQIKAANDEVEINKIP